MAGRIPSLNWLRVFEAAARLGSFAAAARELNMTASAVSQQIRALEDHLGTPLFLRGARHVSLTDAGRSFLPSVQGSLRIVETTAGSLFGRRRRTALTVQVVHLFAVSWLAPRLAAFRAGHPEILLTLTSGNQVEDFVRSTADLRVYSSMDAIGGSGDGYLCSETLFPVALPEIAAAVTRASDLLQWPLIDVSAHGVGWLQIIETLDPELEVPEASLIFVDNTSLAFAIAASGGGIALARSPIGDALMRRFGLAPCVRGFRGLENRGYWIGTASGTAQGPAAEAFRSWLLSELTS
ncbi:MAG: LysR family transcriptional regulator [Pseudomonadota bacterium]